MAHAFPNGRAELARRNGVAPRKDDNAETLRNRLVEYERNKEATLKVLATFLRIASIDGEPPKDVVGHAIENALERVVQLR